MNRVSGTESEKGFMQRWVHAWLFWGWPAAVFAALYAGFGLMVARRGGAGHRSAAQASSPSTVFTAATSAEILNGLVT